ncbi:nitroreductase family protein [Mycolicibacterium setense]|uniref:nitroreductase family protein n=1 Tax=Mycolicibacterium setense TaxID=431269 RepID=UPI000574AFF4|nr:nitroreductase family protein [Mycolicibacterium setense]KHO22211.1 nitroreductase [Mycolicibacterium setense]MCV7114742.1 nitroreductase family protein [Mycolicibacterium setense]
MRTATAVRRYRDESVPDAVLEKCLLAASWAPSGGNGQPWRFVVLNSPELRELVTAAARRTWEVMKDFYKLPAVIDGAGDPRSRMLRTMAEHMQVGGAAPVLVLFCVQPQRGTTELQQGGSIFPAVQNFLLSARAQGLGAAITLWHDACDAELRSFIGIPGDWKIATLLTVGWPAGRHHPVRRRPLSEVAMCNRWDRPWLA